jgi:hypothetical protein
MTKDPLYRALQEIDPARGSDDLVPDEEWRALLARIVESDSARTRAVPRRVALAAAAVVAGLAVVLLGPGVNDDPLSGALAIEQHGDVLHIHVADATADPDQMTRDLRAQGLDARVELVPASPAYVGRWISVNDNAGTGNDDRVVRDLVRQVTETDGPGAEVLKVPAGYGGELVFKAGRPAADGEVWDVAYAADVPDETRAGGLVYCLQLLDPPDIDAALVDRGYHVEWRDAHADFSDPVATGIMEGPPGSGVPVYSELLGDDYLVITVAAPATESATRPSLVERREAAARDC